MKLTNIIVDIEEFEEIVDFKYFEGIVDERVN